MFKVFDHDSYDNTWKEVDDVETYLATAFDESYWQDKDNSYTHYIEVWDSNTNTITVHACHEGSWLYCPNNESPICERTYGTIDQYKNDDWFRPTTLNPTKDYIIV